MPAPEKNKSLESWIWDAACSIRGAKDAAKYSRAERDRLPQATRRAGPGTSVNDSFLPLIFTKRLSKRYLFHVFNLPHLRVEVAKTSTRSKVKHTSPTKLRAVKVGVPPTVDEQEEIAGYLGILDQKLENAGQKTAQLRDLFRTLLHDLMTAKTRVHELNFQSQSHE